MISGQSRAYRPMAKIFKGRTASYGEHDSHPYLVSIQFLNHDPYDDEDYYQHFCGGAILNRRTIITVAHCFPSYLLHAKGNRFRIVAGEHNLQATESEQIQIISTDSIKVHEDYDGFHNDNDIALIHLKQPLHFNSYVHPIRLAKPNGNYSKTGQFSI